MQNAGSAFAGVAFHCYAGQVANQDLFHSAFPDKEIYFTECASTYGSDWWSDIKVGLLTFIWIVGMNPRSYSGRRAICELSNSCLYVAPTIYVLSSWIGAITHNAQAALMWNIALDGSGNPKLPGTNSCSAPGCRALVQVNSDGSYEMNQECTYLSGL
jgi:O-glycosyl hydrolase